jgi:hypothetical protein
MTLRLVPWATRQSACAEPAVVQGRVAGRARRRREMAGRREQSWHSAERLHALGDPIFTVGDDTLVVAQEFRLITRMKPGTPVRTRTRRAGSSSFVLALHAHVRTGPGYRDLAGSPEAPRPPAAARRRPASRPHSPGTTGKKKRSANTPIAGPRNRARLQCRPCGRAKAGRTSDVMDRDTRFPDMRCADARPRQAIGRSERRVRVRLATATRPRTVIDISLMDRRRGPAGGPVSRLAGSRLRSGADCQMHGDPSTSTRQKRMLALTIHQGDGMSLALF